MLKGGVCSSPLKLSATGVANGSAQVVAPCCFALPLGPPVHKKLSKPLRETRLALISTAGLHDRDDAVFALADATYWVIEGMGLWGVPSYQLSGPDGEADLEVWGQDRLWLVAAEIKRRAAAYHKA